MKQLKIDQLSYWEKNEFFNNIDFVIIGSGIVGLSTAIELKTQFPNAKILIVERGYIPTGASTKNAGFACFGSVSELLYDLEKMSEKDVSQLLEYRWEGLKFLRKRLGDKAIDYQQNGSYELFTSSEKDKFEACKAKIPALNNFVENTLGLKNCFQVLEDNHFRFKNISGMIYSPFEGQIDTGKMMINLLRKAIELRINIINSIELKQWTDAGDSVKLETTIGEIKCKQLIICTNGFTHLLLPHIEVKPARAQVILTKPIKDLHIKGIFHYQEGYYYFRNIHDRVLFGGARNLDFKGEETHEFGNTDIITSSLKNLLADVILPDTAFEIEQQWSGIMGVGASKMPLINQHSNNVFYGVRLGGMGIAMGSKIGSELARLIKMKY